MKLFTTVFENGKKATEVSDIAPLTDGKGLECNMINLNPEIEYQTFKGFGGAATEAAGYAYSKLSEENQRKVMELYFSREGNNYCMVRSHIDSCDFSLGIYSAVEDSNDVDMNSLSLKREEKYILPLLTAAKKTAGELDLMLSPWSPPAYMKTNGLRTHGGSLKPECRGLYAEYICRYIKEYEGKGFTVNRITVQNEPAAVQTWDSCIYSAEEEKEFLRDYLYPALIKNGLSHVKINIWDHNKERMYERARVIIDKDTDKMVDGVAFHWYTGDHFEAIKITHEAFPDKELIFSEGCVEYSRFDADQLKNAQMYAHDIIGNLNNGMTASIDWNLLLDEKGGPNHVGNFCDAPIMVNTQNGDYKVNLSFDYIGHFSRHIRRGAKRIAFSSYTSRLEVTAFKNTDGSVALVVMNRGEENLPVIVYINGEFLPFNAPARSISTALI